MRSLIEEERWKQRRLEYEAQNHPDRMHRLLAQMELEPEGVYSDEEHLAAILYDLKPKKGLDPFELAGRLLEKFGGIENVLPAKKREIMKVEGMYSALADRLCWYYEAMMEYARQERSAYSERIRIFDVQMMGEFVAMCMRAYSDFPATWMFCFDEGFTLLHMQLITPSRYWEGEKFFEDCIITAKYYKAKQVVMVQYCDGNEPVKILPYDRKHGKILEEFLRQRLVTLLDIFIVGNDGKFVSMYQKGTIAPPCREKYGKNVYGEDMEQYYEIYRPDGEIDVGKYVNPLEESAETCYNDNDHNP